MRIRRPVLLAKSLTFIQVIKKKFSMISLPFQLLIEISAKATLLGLWHFGAGQGFPFFRSIFSFSGHLFFLSKKK